MPTMLKLDGEFVTMNIILNVVLFIVRLVAVVSGIESNSLLNKQAIPLFTLFQSFHDICFYFPLS